LTLLVGPTKFVGGLTSFFKGTIVLKYLWMKFYTIPALNLLSTEGHEGHNAKSTSNLNISKNYK
jgi:hypothetical protein